MKFIKFINFIFVYVFALCLSHYIPFGEGLAAQGGFTIAISISDGHLLMLLGMWFTLRHWPQP